MLVLTFILLGAFAALVVFNLDLSWNNVTLPARNNIVFEKKNKAYGAFQLRAHYAHTLMVSVLITLFGTAAVCIAPFFFHLTSEPAQKVVPVDQPWELKKPPIGDEKPLPLQQQQKSVAASQTAGTTSRILVVTEDPIEPATQPVEQPGDGTSPTAPAGPVTPTGNAGGGTATATTPAIVPFADVAPEFVGGEEALMRYLSENIRYPQMEADAGIQGVVILTFVVDQNGNIIDVKELKGVKGGPNLTKEAMRVVRSMPRWIPGRMGSTAVPVQFNLPVRFSLR